MHELRTNRRQQTHQNVIGCANAFCMRVPVFDILKEINARWAYELVRLFLSGDSEKEIVFDSSLAGDTGFTASPSFYVPSFLTGYFGFGGNAPPESQRLAKAMGFAVAEEQDDLDAVNSLASDEEVTENFAERLTTVLKHILDGSTEYSLGSRAGKLAYLLEFLAELEGKLTFVLGNEPSPSDARVSNLYLAVVQAYTAQAKQLKTALYETHPDFPMGLIQELQNTSSEYQDTQDELNRIGSRKYFWGESEEDSYADDWYARYLNATQHNYLDLIGWVVDETGIDLRLRIKGESVLLKQHGLDRFIEALSSFALGLSKDAWQNVSLDKILSSRHLLQDSLYGAQIRQKIDYNTGQLFYIADTGLNPGKLLMLANQNILERFTGYEFLDGLCTKPAFSQIDFGDITTINSTDRYAISFLRLMDAIRTDRLRSVHVSKRQYVKQVKASVFLEEVHASEIEAFEEYPKDDDLKLLHSILTVGFTNRTLVESFCLALAEGLITKLPNNKIRLSDVGGAGPAEVILSEHEYPRIDLTVNALINWGQEPKQEFAAWRVFLKQRYQNRNRANREMLRQWVNWPNITNASWFTEGNPENEALKILTTVYTRYLLRNQTRKW
jgi:hypothetical protein